MLMMPLSLDVTASTLDDLMRTVLSALLKEPFSVVATRGTTAEAIGCRLHLTNPLARLSRTETKGTLFSAIGELLWYLARRNDLAMIAYYLKYYRRQDPARLVVDGGYGPRLFNFRGQYNQVATTIDLLRRKPTTRQAVIQLFDAEDVAGTHHEVPCTCTLQFLVRDKHLHLVVHMRSNDAYLGLPHDVFTFTMLQEIVARSLDITLGSYYHFVGSLHLYNDKITKTQQYLAEGIQPTTLAMPLMPAGDPWPAISQVVAAEDRIRNGMGLEPADLALAPYWLDLLRLLQVYQLSKAVPPDPNCLAAVATELSTKVYDTYISKRVGYVMRA
ncbi:MAG: thymidylate synthase [Hymenobacter sp.]|nr:MAG: thymidylate synthase [Hymenobacter sp.]